MNCKYDIERRIDGGVDLPILFTKEASQLYVYEEPLTPETNLRYQRLTDDEIHDVYNYAQWEDVYERIPSTIGPNIFHTKEKENATGIYDPERSNNVPPSTATWLEYDQAVRQLNLQTVKKLKRMIYEATINSLQ